MLGFCFVLFFHIAVSKYLTKVTKEKWFAESGGNGLWSQLLRRLREEDLLSPGVMGCSVVMPMTCPN